MVRSFPPRDALAFDARRWVCSVEHARERVSVATWAGVGVARKRGRDREHKQNKDTRTVLKVEPHRIDVLVLRERRREGWGVARDEVDDAAGEVRGVENLVQVSCRERMLFRGRRVFKC